MRKPVRALVILAGAALLLTAAYSGVAGAEPIETGFVFVDGAYLDAPYAVEAHDLAVHVNGLRVTKPLVWPPLQEYLFDHDPGFPDGITRNTSLKDALNVREPGGMLFDTAKQRYLFSHLPYDEAYRRMEEYYRSLPCVEDMHQDTNGTWILRAFNGKTLRIVFGEANIRRLSEWYGPEGDGPPPLSEYEGAVENRAERIRERLEKGDLFLLYSDGTETSFAERRAAALLPEMVAALKSGMNTEAKSQELYSLGAVQRGDEHHARLLIEAWEQSPTLEERVEILRETVRARCGEDALRPAVRDADLKARNAKEQSLNSDLEAERGRAVAYSPDSDLVYGFCGYTYDSAFSGFDGEVAAVGDYVKDQDFNSSLIIYKDTAGSDSDAETATYDNLKAMRYSDLLYIAVHGSSGGSLFFVLLRTQADVENWCGNDPLINASVDTGEDWPPTGHPYYAVAASGWATSNWKTMLDQSKAISILSCCYSHVNGWAGACGGAAAFGYDQSCTGTGCETNNENLLKRMNGTTGDGEYRKAYEAYNNMPSHLHEFRITPANAEATLAPAPEAHEPEDDELVDTEGSGYFQLDTYCMATVDAEEALTFDTDGDVTISDVHWVGTGRSNRIEFDWAGTGEFEVTVTAHANKIASWGQAIGGTHELDGDGVAPNGDDYEFSFKSRPKSVLFVIDDTGSMWDEIADVKVALHNLIDSFEASGERILYTLITFKDYVQYRGQTEDPSEISLWVTALNADGGGDCPEESCEALLTGASVAPQSEAWWMTDADVHGGWARLAYVRAVLWFSGVRLHSVIMGSCWYDAMGRPVFDGVRPSNDPVSICDLGNPRDQVNSYDAAQYLSEGTGGLYFPVSSDQVQDATEICLEEMTEPTAWACAYDCTGAGIHNVRIDASCTQARFLVNPMGGYITVEVRNPSGTLVDGTHSGVTLMTAGSTRYLIVESPALAAGTWTVETSGVVDDYVMRCSLVTPVTFEYLGETSGACGVPMDIIVDIDGEHPAPSFAAVSLDGASQIPLNLYDDGVHSDGAPGDGRYGGSFTATAASTYRIMATGASSFSRADPAKIYFGAMAVEASGARYAAPGDTVVHTLAVQNLSDDAESYELEFESSMGWADLSGLPATVLLEPDSSYVANIDVVVPETAFNGEEDELTLSAVQESDPLVSGTASARTIAWSGPLIESITPEIAVRGEIITISGDGFGADPGSGNHSTVENNVMIGSMQLSDDAIQSWTPGAIQACVPNGVDSGEQDVYVTAGGIGSNPLVISIAEGAVGLSNESVYFFPNPFNPDADRAGVSYSLARAADVTVRLYDSAGHHVATALDGVSRPARARQTDTWDGTDDSGDIVANGVYFYVIETSEGERAVGTVAVLR